MAAHERLSVGQFQASGAVSTPTPDGGSDSRTAGPIIQQNWERLRDTGMSAQEATTRLHTLTPTVSTSSGRAPAEGTNPSWLNSQQMPVAPNNATISGPTIPRTVAAPERPGSGGDLGWFHQPPTIRTNSYGPAGQFINRFVVDQA